MKKLSEKLLTAAIIVGIILLMFALCEKDPKAAAEIIESLADAIID